MNAALSAIAALEGDASRLMIPPPIAHHDHGNGRVEEVPLVSREFLMKCGVEALYIVCADLDADERFDIETKEGLADLIIAKTAGQQPAKEQLMPPLVPARPVTAREKRQFRSFKRQINEARNESRRSHGVN